MEHNKIFNRFFNAAASRDVNWDAATMDEKFSVLKSQGLEIDETKEYAVLETAVYSDDKADEYAKKALSLGASFAQIMAKETISKEVKKTGKNLSKRQMLDVLSRDMEKTEDGKIKVYNFGGENFVSWCEWLRGLAEEEFKALCTKEETK